MTVRTPTQLLVNTVLLLTIRFAAADHAAPTNVRITEITCTTATVVWDRVNGATGYQVDFELINSRTSLHSTGTQSISGTNPPTSITIERLRSSSDYSVTVTSLQNGGTSPAVTFTTCDNSGSNMNGIPAPTIIQVSEVTDSSALISWDSVDNVNEYRVWGGLLNESVTMTTDVTGGITSIRLNNLLPNRQYGVTVSSLSIGIVVNTSDEVQFTTNPTSLNQSTVPMVTCNGTLLVAPMDLTIQIVSHQMLVVSWNYPSSLLAQTMFKVTYSLVAAYNTSVGIRTFAESDVFNTTQTSFHFALISSVTNYIFTVTPYSATCPGHSKKVLADDFAKLHLEDPVIFFNLRLHDTLNSPSHIEKTNSDLTRLIQSSIEDICQCTLPSYTLRGSMDLCDSQTNCAIYTGRLLGSDTASATEVFEMVEDWLVTQNGSLLNGTLSIDPDCPLRRYSPSDSACSTPNSIPPSNDDDDDDDDDDEFKAIMLVIIFASALVIVIICSGIIICAVCVCRSRKTKRKDLPISSTVSSTQARPLVKEDNERHYSIIVDGNPSYGNSLIALQNCAELQNITVANGNSHIYQPPMMNTNQQEVTQSPSTMAWPETSSSSYYVGSHLSTTEYCNEHENGIPKPTPPYLSIIHTE